MLGCARMIQVRRALLLMVVAASLSWLVGCGGSQRAAAGHAAAHHTATRTRGPATWRARLHVAGVLDLTAERPDGTFIVAAAGHLNLLSPGGRLRRFAPSYSYPAGLEAYVALSTGERVPGAGCGFPSGELYALRLNHGVGVTAVTPGGPVRRFVSLPPSGLENGIAFDSVGRFGHRLLVTATKARRTTLFAIDCRGRVRILTRHAPRVEGGLAVAPPSFGRFAGDLIAPDEVSGVLYALTPKGSWSLLARSDLPHGQDVGVESEGFVPAHYGQALVSDRRTPGNPHPGDDLLLGLPRAALSAEGVRTGDLLVAGEGGGASADVRCQTSCQVRKVATGPAIAHIEGHIVFSGAAGTP